MVQNKKESENIPPVFVSRKQLKEQAVFPVFERLDKKEVSGETSLHDVPNGYRFFTKKSSDRLPTQILKSVDDLVDFLGLQFYTLPPGDIQEITKRQLVRLLSFPSGKDIRAKVILCEALKHSKYTSF